MKIGILTYWTSQDNYGQLLQAYALQKYLLNAGHQPFIIRYVQHGDYKRSFKNIFFNIFNIKRIILFLRDKVKNTILCKDSDSQSRGFDDFRKQFFCFSEKIYNSFDELKMFPPVADCYIVGSDQVWNFGTGDIVRIKNWVHAYFLDFGNTETCRLSYAASWGRESISKSLAKEVQPLLKRFYYVSVREKNGVELCRQCGCNYAELVCDPTLLFDANHYREFYSKNVSVMSRKPYLFLYLLDNGYDFSLDAIYNWADSNQLEVVFVTGNGTVSKKKKENLTIPEWLYYVDHANAVVTNSFHCAVFSILFRKSFGVIPLVGKNSGMNTRISNLFSITGIEDHFLRTVSDFSYLNEELSPKFNFSIDRLNSILNDIKNRNQIKKTINQE